MIKWKKEGIFTPLDLLPLLDKFNKICYHKNKGGG